MTDNAHKIVAALEKMMEAAEAEYEASEDEHAHTYLQAMQAAHSKALSIAEGFSSR